MCLVTVICFLSYRIFDSVDPLVFLTLLFTISNEDESLNLLGGLNLDILEFESDVN